MVFITHIDKVDDDNATQIAQAKLAGDGLRGFDVGIKDGVIQVAMADKRAGVDIHRRHRFGLIDDQIAARLQFNLAFQRSLDLIFDVIEIEDRLTPCVMLQQARHFGNVFGSKFQQCFIGQAGIHANSVELCIGKITQDALSKRQFAVKLVAGLVAFFTLHDFGPDALEVGRIRRQIVFTDPFCGGTDDKPALFIAVSADHFFKTLALAFALNALRNAHVRRARHKDQITGRQGNVGSQTGAFRAQRIFDDLHHQILALTHQFGDIAHGKLLLLFARDALGMRHNVGGM